ncbi:MAG TPA: hypothetical protein VLT86_04190 [Vicinamibacterales bacterium]|nr:hypothetical protein [Vicinamibacterales bacterium]
MIVERPNLERRVLASLEAARIPVLLGACGTGRTSTLLRLARLLGPDRAQYLDVAAAATTPERCLASIGGVCRFRARSSAPAAVPASARAAFDALLTFFDQAAAPDGGPVTFLLDEFLDVRTFENFPGLRHVQRELVARLAASSARFVLASRFTERVHRLLRDAPATFEVIHVPSLDSEEAIALALAHDGGRRDWAASIAPAVVALTAGRAGYVNLLLDALASMGPASDPVAALAALFAPEGRLTARCRESYEFRLHRARGYGALKAILGVLAEDEPLNLTEISHHLRRTPGSTKDYLSWLEDVDLVTFQGKRYAFEDPLLRLFVRLYAQPVPPSDDVIVREVGMYARPRLPSLREPVPVAASSAKEVMLEGHGSGIIEID